MSLITPDSGLIIWMTLIFAIVFFVLAKFGFPIITGMVSRRNDYIGKSLSDAREAQQQLANIAQEQEKLIEKARVEQTRIINEASAARDKIVAQAQNQAREEAAKILDQARKDILREKENAMREVRSQVAALSVDVAEKLLRRSLDSRDKQEALLDTLIEEARTKSIRN